VALRVILIVDDEEEIRGTLKEALERRIPDVQVRTADSGEQGLAVMQEALVDLVITDLKMPGMTGLEFLVQARGLSPRAPRIMMTGFDEHHIGVDAVKSAGVDRILSKPFSLRDVISTVTQLLARTLHEVK
jgi:YesN/AraC family two-component response regulator